MYGTFNRHYKKCKINIYIYIYIHYIDIYMNRNTSKREFGCVLFLRCEDGDKNQLGLRFAF